MKKVIIIGAGPAGLTAAWEILQKSDLKPIVIEMDSQVGGISKTVFHNGKRMDLGGHRFFSKSSKVLDFWFSFLPPEKKIKDSQLFTSYQNQSHSFKTPNTKSTSSEESFLLRPRKSRIYFEGKFFDYPISLSAKTLKNLGLIRLIKVFFTYLSAKLFPIKKEESLEDFYINRFGKELYQTFFESYTGKVWGIPCKKISAEWGAQRVKNLSVKKIIKEAIKSFFGFKNNLKEAETSLIEQFLYPYYGPGQLWEEVAKQIEKKGGEIWLNSIVEKINHCDGVISDMEVRMKSGSTSTLKGDYFISSMPVQNLNRALNPSPKEEVLSISDNLSYRDFLVVGVELKNLSKKNIKDNWIYIQSGKVKLGRIQFFHNWSPGMNPNSSTYWLGLEYFCFTDDEIWNWEDSSIADFAMDELEKINIAKKESLIDYKVVRIPKAYPSYTGVYSQFDEVKNWVSRFENLFLVGRNGMHKYNNQDHSMLTAMKAVDLIINNSLDNKTSIWEVNTEKEYHEEVDTANS